MAIPHKVRKIGGGCMIAASVLFEFFGNATGGSDLAQNLPVPESWRSHLPFAGFAAGALLLVWAFYADKCAAELALDSAKGGARERLKTLLHRGQQLLAWDYIVTCAGGCLEWIDDIERWYVEVSDELQENFTRADLQAFKEPNIPDVGWSLARGLSTDDWNQNGAQLSKTWKTMNYRKIALKKIIDGTTE